MQHLLSSLFCLLVFSISSQNVFAQENKANNIIEGKSAFLKRGLTFDPYQHQRLILLSDINKNYDLKTKALQTSEPYLNNSSITKIITEFSSNQSPAASKTILTNGKNTQITFLVVNDTNKNLWVADISQSTFLPHTYYKEVDIYNSIDNKKLATLNKNQSKQILSLKKETPYIFTISLESPSNKWGNHSLNLYSYGSVYDTATMSYIEMFFTVISISIFIASTMLILHLPLPISSLSVIGWGIFSLGNILNTTTTNSYLLEFIPSMFVIWLPFITFAYRKHLQKSLAPQIVLSSNLIALAFSIIMAVTSITSSLNASPPDSNILNYIIFTTFIISAMLSLSSSIFTIISKPSTYNTVMIVAWSILILGVVLTSSSLINSNVIPASQVFISTYSISVMLFGFCWVMFLSNSIKTTNKTTSDSKKNEQTTTQLSEKLSEAREGFDNMRLVQVLKRERIIMQELRDKDVKLTKKMKEEKEKADYANSAKSAFLAVISHEIRTPMTGIMGMVRLLKNSNLDEEQDDHVNTISDSSDSMVALLNDILDFEKIDTGKMKLESIEFDLYNLLKNVQSLMLGRTEEKSIDLKLEIEGTTPQYIYGDPTRLRQILLNLISNAIKFTDNGHVSIQTKIMEQKDNDIQIYFAVQDTGLGIPKEAQENLFNPFAQADSSTSRKYGGSGLGLAICQKLVHQMGGEININSTPNEGSTFFFSILTPKGKDNDSGAMIPPVINKPVQIKKEATKPDKQNKVKPNTLISNDKRKSIMVVDDNDINQKVMSGFISPLGHKVHSFSSGQKAIDALKETPNKFDIIFMDIEMPGINGIETTRIIREDLKIDKSTLPIVALTGNTGEKEVASYIDIGMTGFIAKPIDADVLEEMISGSKNKTTTVVSETRPIEKPKNYVSHKPNENMHKTTLDIMDTGLSIDDPTQEEEKKKEADSNYNPADFDSSTLTALKTSMNQKDLSKMVNDLIDKMNKIYIQVSSSVKDGKLDIVSARAHDLKGMSANFGLVGISNRASLIEDAIKSAAPSEATLKKLSESLGEDIKQAHTYLKQWT